MSRIGRGRQALATWWRRANLGPSHYLAYPLSTRNNDLSNLTYVLPRRMRRHVREGGDRLARTMPPGLLDQVAARRQAERDEDELASLLTSATSLQAAQVIDRRLGNPVLLAGGQLEPPAPSDEPEVSRQVAFEGVARSPHGHLATAGAGFFCRVSRGSAHRQPCWAFPFADSGRTVSGCVAVNSDNGIRMFDLVERR